MPLLSAYSFALIDLRKGKQNSQSYFRDLRCGKAMAILVVLPGPGWRDVHQALA